MATLKQLKTSYNYAAQALAQAFNDKEKSSAVLGMDLTAVAIKEREADLKAVWRTTHKDFKGVVGGVKSILIYRNGTTLCPLDELTAEEIHARLPKKEA